MYIIWISRGLNLQWKALVESIGVCLKQLQFLLVVPIHGDLHPTMSDGFRQTVLWNFMCSSIYLTNMPSGCSVVTSDALPYLSNIHLKCAHLHFGGFSDPLDTARMSCQSCRFVCAFSWRRVWLWSVEPVTRFTSSTHHPGLGVLVLFGLNCRFPMV